MSDEPHADDWLVGTPMDPLAVAVEPLPRLPGFPFLHAGSGAMIVGPTGRGRSSLIQACLYDSALAGESCAYLGCEVTAEEFNVRATIKAQLRGDPIDDQLRAKLERVRYLDLPSVVAHAWVHPDLWVETVVARYALIALDPLSAAASALDLDFDKSNAEFIKFYDRLIQPLTSRGVAVAIVDNVGHAEEARTRAKGASAKQDRADLTFSCTLSTTPPGLIIKAGKVRSVRAGFQRGDEWIFLKENQRIVARDRNDTEDRAAFRPTTIMRRVSEAIEQDEGLTRRAIRTTIGGRAEYVDLAIELLVSEGYIEAHKDGQAHRHQSIRPYREDNNDTPTVSTVSTPCPNRVPDTLTDTVSHRVPHPVGVGPGTGHGSEDPEPDNNRVPLCAVTADCEADG
ncbi:MAG: hypothetical protein WA484_10330 [Solirubrobacteraceae bacterium]